MMAKAKDSYMQSITCLGIAMAGEVTCFWIVVTQPWHQSATFQELELMDRMMGDTLVKAKTNPR